MSAEPDYLPADALAEEEPKYLRRQKPVEIRKRKFSGKAWPLYRRVLVGGIAALASGLVLYQAGRYFLFSPSVMIERADQIVIRGNRFVPPEAIVEKFSADLHRRDLIVIRGNRFVPPEAIVKKFSADLHRSVVRVPLGERRQALESLPWVEHADVQRVLPNRIRVEITEPAPHAGRISTRGERTFPAGCLRHDSGSAG